ncbi:uncharacterized protein LOC114760875 [Neltuma alba]|uniref:uncharacterized protein LOC114760875 n=1 Tax=Neltuma alba TaxID=207710 RepID=UPI0010A40E15|nr:uncharacterized protein LOC114760875 [Prosopis alba]
MSTPQQPQSKDDERGKEIGAKKVQFKEDEEDEEPVDKEIEVESPPSKTTQDIPKATQETSIQSKEPIEKGSPPKGDEMPKCAEFLKDLCTNKRKYRHSKRIQLRSSISVIFKPRLPIKCKDPGSYTIPCTIDKINISHALLDLGVAINAMSTSIYESLGIYALKDTSVVLGLTDRTMRHPKGFLKDVLVQVKGIVFPADFYKLDMTDEIKVDNTLILGRPFLRTAQTIINVKDGIALTWVLI